jgi:hypothetical protein
MSRDSKNYIFLKGLLISTLLLLNISNSMSQQLIHNLKQDWVSYSQEHQGFLPVDEQNLTSKVISFSLKNDEFNPFYLSISVNHKAYLFYRGQLLSQLNPGWNNFRIDSLKEVVMDSEPFFSIHGNNLLPNLVTEVRTKPIIGQSAYLFKPSRFSNSFSNFFYTAFTFLLFIIVVLKTRFPELTNQYFLLQRTFRFKTIDELIYKIPYLRAPNIFFLFLISTLFAFSTLCFMYFFPGELEILGVSPSSDGFWNIGMDWGIVTLIIFTAIILKYFLTAIMSSVFGLNITNIHYASLVRLVFIMALLMATISLTQFLIPDLISEQFYWIVLVVGLIIIEVILFFKLTLVTGHTLLYIIVYLCATELIPVVFLFKLYTT